MSETAQKLFASLKAIKETAFAIAPGLENFGPEVAAEGKRLLTQGAMEVANLLHNGHAFVPYGPGQYTQSAEHRHENEHEHSRGMER